MPIFQPEADVIDDVPVLSWLVDLCGRGKILVGSQIEVLRLSSGIYVFEGAWDDNFESAGFATSPYFFGSGFVIDDKGVTFSTSSDTLESLYVLQNARGFLVSNSLSFLTSFASLNLRADRKITKKMYTIVEGLHNYDSILYDSDDCKITRLVYCNFHISGEDVDKIYKKEPPHFDSYNVYKSYVVQTLEKLFENAKSPRRKVRHKVLTTISSGYDSVACAALASDLGVENTLTIKTSRLGSTDSGKAVADALGLECIEKKRTDPSKFGNYAEAEFIVGGAGGDISLLCFEQQLAGSILLTGFHGDKIWDLHTPPTPYIKRGDDSGTGLHEFRLRNGFINVPVPFIGAVRHRDLHEIAHSDEMLPYRVGNDYDRPLARRMAEEAGVPRELFGQKKKATGFLLTKQEGALSQKTRQAVDDFIRMRFGLTMWMLERLHNILRDFLNSVWSFSTWKLSRGTDQASSKVGRFLLKGCRILSALLLRLYESLWSFDKYNDVLLIWALEKTGARYRKVRCDSGTRVE